MGLSLSSCYLPCLPKSGCLSMIDDSSVSYLGEPKKEERRGSWERGEDLGGWRWRLVRAQAVRQGPPSLVLVARRILKFCHAILRDLENNREQI
eukprot:scaffold248382_cov35-Tisochrysis_lutea.AAC.4